MHNKQRKHFAITLLASLAIHLFVLTVLFTPPNISQKDEYKKIRVKVGVRNKPAIDSIAMAKQYTQYTPGAGSVKQNSQNGSGKKDVAAISTSHKQATLPKVSQQKNNEDKEFVEEKNVSSYKIDQAEFGEQKFETENTTKGSQNVAASFMQTDEAPMQIPYNYGAVIGNASDEYNDKIASYEQMLSLWLDKFKRYPAEINDVGKIVRGEVFVKIDRNGKVLLSKVIKSTGYPQYDQALMKMIADADPVLPVPLDYHPDNKTFSYKIEFEF